MINKIVSIKKKSDKITIPDGLYSGIWGGYVIEMTYKNDIYELTTEEGVRGFGIKVVVEIKDGKLTFDELS